MAKTALTSLLVSRLRPPERGRVEYWDARLPGFGLRVSASGKKTWMLMYRVRRRQRRQTLGHYPSLDLAKAREKARTALDQLERGQDPGARRDRLKAAAADTFDGTADLFLKSYARRRQRRPEQTAWMLAKHVRPAWGERRLESIGRADVADLVDGIAEASGPTMANRVLTMLKRLFGWAVEQDLLDASPAALVAKPAREVSRDRVLDGNEIKALWEACEALGYPFGPLVQLLLLTGQRRDEVAHMAWPDLDGDERNLWHMPRALTKSDRGHTVPLSALARDVIAAVPRLDGADLLFPSRNGKDRPVSGFSKAKRELDRLSGVEGWRLHDLRRTMASGLARMHTPPHVVEAVLNHSSGTISGVAAVYNRYDYQAEKRAALDAWADHVAALLAENIVHLELA